MLKFSANINWLFRELDFADRFSAARDAGFLGVEFHHAEGCRSETVAEIAAHNGLAVSLFNASTGDFVEGGAGCSGVPGRERDFREIVEDAASFGCGIGGGAAIQIGPSRVPKGIPRADCMKVFIENMRFAARELLPINCRVLIEPMNPVDFPDALIVDVDTALKVIEEAAVDNLGLLLDCYHEAMAGGDVIATIKRVQGCIDHLQFSDAPGRGEPGAGTLDFPAIFRTLEQIGYKKWLAAEYQPTGSSDESLRWLQAYFQKGG